MIAKPSSLAGLKAGFLALLCATASMAVAASPADLSRAEILRLGERMYREGILPSGEVMVGYIRGDVKVDSSAFSCSNCHMRAGLGSSEGGIVAPPVTGTKLYKPYRRPPALDRLPDGTPRKFYVETVKERQAYTRETLAAAIRGGVDPAGQVLNPVMPRYPLAERDMAILIAYLEMLSGEPSPGASFDAFRFATIVSDEVAPEERRALLGPLEAFISQKNQQREMYKDFRKFGYTPTIDMKSSFRRASLDVWELKGPPETWQGQLAAYYAKGPVFAVLGGISNGDWRPIHDFCEAQRLPCLFPITDLPVVSETGWYTFYFNKGYALEGEAAAGYLDRLDDLAPATPILQIVQDSAAGRALAAGFGDAWKERGHPPATSLALTADELRDGASLERLLVRQKPGVLLLWVDADILPLLPRLLPRLRPPAMVFVSSSLLGKKAATVAEAVRDKVYLTFPYRLTPYVGPKTGGYDARVPVLTSARDFGERRIASRTVNMLQQATLQGLNLIHDNLYRDHLLDVMSLQMDLIVRDYERFSFGPGQRYVSKGCYIIQLGPGADPPLLPRSEWVIH